MKKHWFGILAVAVCLGSAAGADLIGDSGIKGGVVVVLGTGNLELINAADRGPYTIQFLDTDLKKVEKAREAIRKKGLYGRVSANVYDGKNLPYIDNMVNLLVVLDRGCRVPEKEMRRVLAPGGVLLAKENPKAGGGNRISPKSCILTDFGQQ